MVVFRSLNSPEGGAGSVATGGVCIGRVGKTDVLVVNCRPGGVSWRPLGTSKGEGCRYVSNDFPFSLGGRVAQSRTLGVTGG